MEQQGSCLYSETLEDQEVSENQETQHQHSQQTAAGSVDGQRSEEVKRKSFWKLAFMKYGKKIKPRYEDEDEEQNPAPSQPDCCEDAQMGHDPLGEHLEVAEYNSAQEPTHENDGLRETEDASEPKEASEADEPVLAAEEVERGRLFKDAVSFFLRPIFSLIFPEEEYDETGPSAPSTPESDALEEQSGRM